MKKNKWHFSQIMPEEKSLMSQVILLSGTQSMIHKSLLQV